MSHPVARTQGVADGAKAAEISNVALATAMGVQRGATVGIELGFYRGVAAAWVAKGNMCVRRVSFSQTLHSNSLRVSQAHFCELRRPTWGKAGQYYMLDAITPASRPSNTRSVCSPPSSK